MIRSLVEILSLILLTDRQSVCRILTIPTVGLLCCRVQIKVKKGNDLMNCVLMLIGVALLGTAVSTAGDLKTSEADSKELEALNREYVRSAVGSDVAWFERRLAADFMCSNPDGSLVDRAGFLKQTAVPRGISNI